MKPLMLGVVLGVALPLASATADDFGRNLFDDVGETLGASLSDARQAVRSSLRPAAYDPPVYEDYGDYEDSAEPVAAASAELTSLAARQGVGCTDACTDGCTDTCCTPCTPCCPEFWEHRTGAFAEFLYLSPGNVDFAYAMPVDGTTATAVPIGSVAVIDPDYNPGFRVGGMWALDSCSSFVATYSWYESHATHSQSVAGGGVGGAGPFMQALTVHPSTVDVAADSLDAAARYDIDFQTADLVYKGLIRGTCYSSLNYVLGLRYGHLDQDFAARYTVNGQTDVMTDIDFDGIGPRIGLLGERLIGHGLLVYAKGHANFLIGDFNASYEQVNVFDGVQARSSIEDDRIVSLLEMELGLGWQDCCGNCRVTAGYLVQAWYNTMTTPAYIRSVQSSGFDEVDETLTFDGLTIRAEYRF